MAQTPSRRRPSEPKRNLPEEPPRRRDVELAVADLTACGVVPVVAEVAADERHAPPRELPRRPGVPLVEGIRVERVPPREGPDALMAHGAPEAEARLRGVRDARVPEVPRHQLE